ncbi:MAG: M56 family metallopeptidase [Bacteroidota bacterium]
MRYLLLISIYWLASWLFYRLFLEKERFLRLNRLYLLFTFALSLVLPFLSWSMFLPSPDWTNTPEIWLPVVAIQSEVAAVAGEASKFNWRLLLLTIWGVGSAVVLYRFAGNLWELSQLIRNGQKVKHTGYAQIKHPKIDAPFSWFSFLFWNGSQDLTEDESQAIIAHELAHIQQGHSWDLLFMELGKIIFWWNPLWYAYRHSIEAVHEYLADTQALKSITKSDYGRLLLRQHLLPQPRLLIHTFHTSQLKKRIIMMTKSPSSLLALGKYLMFFPVLLFVLLACEDAEAQQEVAQKAEQELQEPQYYDQVDTIVTFHPESMEEEVQFVKTRIYEVVDQMPVFGDCSDAEGKELSQCSYKNLLMHIYENIKYPEAARTAGQEGTVLLSFVVDKTGEVTNATTVEGKTTEHIILNNTALGMLEDLPKFSPGRQDDQAVNVKMVLPIKFKLADDQ